MSDTPQFRKEYIDRIVAEYGLTIKQAFFCEYYLISLNATHAATKANYSSPQVVGSQLLSNSSVKKYLDVRFAEIRMSANEVLGRLSDIARGDIGDYLSLLPEDTEGLAKLSVKGVVMDGVYIDVKKAILAGKTGRIKSFKKSTKDGTVIELHDPVKALELIGKYNRLFADVTIASTKEDNTIDTLSDEALARIAAQAIKDNDSDSERPADD